MIKIKTAIDHLFNFITENSPVKESKIPKHIKRSDHFEKHIKLLENSGMIEVKQSLFSVERVFVFKTNQRLMNYDSQGIVVL